MEKLTINVSSSSDSISYPICIGAGIIEDIGSIIDFKQYTKVGAIIDENLIPFWPDRLSEAVPVKLMEVVIPSGEGAKNQENVALVWEAFQHYGFDRKSLVLNFGGGMTGDLGGFAASTYMRGIDFAQVPTTLLSHVDASVGYLRYAEKTLKKCTPGTTKFEKRKELCDLLKFRLSKALEALKKISGLHFDLCVEVEEMQ